MFFVESLLTSYNVNILPILLLDSVEYKIYSTPDSFTKYIFDKRNTYAACRAPRKAINGPKANSVKRTQHRLIPIMLGSLIDVIIRGSLEVMKDRKFWGGFIINGSLCCYANFSTFDAMSLHPFSKGQETRVDWFFYYKGQGVSITYNGFTTTCEYMGQMYDNWIDFVNWTSPFGQKINACDYYEFFNAVLDTPYSVNNVENRIIMDPSHMFLRVLKRNPDLNTEKLRSIFNDGTFYASLSKNADTFSKQYTQSALRTMIDGKGDKLHYILPQCSKQMNEKLQNSTAILPGDDVNTIYCMLDVKDMKSAGETNTLTRSTILTQETDQMKVYETITKQCSEEYVQNYKRIAINGFLINRYSKWEKEDLINLKKEHPFIITKVYDKFVNIKTKACYAVRYCEVDDIFYSSAEQMYWKPHYSEYDRMSKITSCLGENFYKTDPSKNTVALNNIKGAVAVHDTPQQKIWLTNALGTTSTMKKLEDNNFTKYAEIEMTKEEKENITATLEYRKNIFKKYEVEVNKLCGPLVKRNNKVTDYTRPREFLKSLHKPIESNIMGDWKKCTKVTVSQKYNGVFKEYMNMFGQEGYEYPGLEVICAFGNSKGKCVEDGVILDSKLVEVLPQLEHNLRITTSFIFNSSVTNHLVLLKNENENDDLIATLVTDLPSKPKHSASCKVITKKIGSHYFNQIYLLTKNYKQYKSYKISHTISKNKVFIIINAEVSHNIRTGSKISNQQGQKNIITDVQDLSSLYGYTADGRKIHAQVLYSDVSLIGRIPGGQLYDMMHSKDTAFSENGTILGKIKIYINSIDPYTNNKIFELKYDTYTHLNGGESQGLSHTGLILRKESAKRLSDQLIGMHGYYLS